MNEEIMRQMGFQEQVERVKQGRCPFCNNEVNVNEFKNEISLKEYNISGMCQKCQDDFFGG